MSSLQNQCPHCFAVNCMDIRCEGGMNVAYCTECETSSTNETMTEREFRLCYAVSMPPKNQPHRDYELN